MFKKTVLTLALGAALLGFSAAPAAADSVRINYNDGNRGGYQRDHQRDYRHDNRGGYRRDYGRPVYYAPAYRYRPAPVYYAPVYRPRPVYREAYYPQPFFGLNFLFR